jgi:hypothetical protein
MILTAVNKSSQCHDRPFVFPHITPMTTGDMQQLSASKTQSSSISKESNECINKGYDMMLSCLLLGEKRQ